MATTLDQELFAHILQLNDAEKRSVLQMLKTFAKGRKKYTNSVSLEQYNKEINEAVARIEAGEYYTHEDALNMLEDI
jgi:uncharacterized FlaG/YvyC family protein